MGIKGSEEKGTLFLIVKLKKEWPPSMQGKWNIHSMGPREFLEKQLEGIKDSCLESDIREHDGLVKSLIESNEWSEAVDKLVQESLLSIKSIEI